MSAGRVIYGAPPYNPPGLVGTRPGISPAYVPLDIESLMPAAMSPSTAIAGANSAAGTGTLRAVPFLVPYPLLMIGFTVVRGTAGAVKRLDIGLYRMLDTLAKPIDADFVEGSLTLISWAATDGTGEWSAHLSEAPTPLAPGWYWLAEKPWSTDASATLLEFSRRTSTAARQRIWRAASGLPNDARLRAAMPDAAVVQVQNEGVNLFSWHVLAA